jgi:quercetin dioxygenase-like cupin family protein
MPGSGLYSMPILEIEHEEVLLQRAALITGIVQYSFPEDCTGKLYKQAEEFYNLVERHMAKEEKAIFHLAEKELSSLEKHEVLAKMESIRAADRAVPTEETTFPAKEYHHFHFSIDEPVTEKIGTSVLLEKRAQQFKALTLKAETALSIHYWSPKQVTIFLYSGEAQWHGPEESTPMKTGDAIPMAPKLSHSVEAKTDCRFLLIVNES